jgi:hypothetical protein
MKIANGAPASALLPRPASGPAQQTLCLQQNGNERTSKRNLGQCSSLFFSASAETMSVQNRGSPSGTKLVNCHFVFLAAFHS